MEYLQRVISIFANAFYKKKALAELCSTSFGQHMMPKPEISWSYFSPVVIPLARFMQA